MALTQQQIDAFEQQRLSFWERLKGQVPALLKGEQYILLALQTISEQLAQIAQMVGGASAGSAGSLPAVAPVGGSSPQTVVAVTFSLDPGRLNEILVATPELSGFVIPTANEFLLTVPAGGQASLVVPAPINYVITFVGPLTINPIDVAANLQAQVTVDGLNMIGQYGFVIGPGGELPTGQLYAKNEVVLTLTNPSTSSVGVYFTVEIVAIAVSFYNGFVAPVLNRAYEAIRSSFGLSV